MSTLTTKGTKFESRIEDPHEAQVEDQKPTKAKEGNLEEGKAAIPTKDTKSGKLSKMTKKSQEKLKTTKSSQNLKSPLESTPHNTLNVNSPPQIDIYHISPLNHPISKSSPNFVHAPSPFDNELIKHKPREERDDMHEIQN
jgi:hypothetical protein